MCRCSGVAMIRYDTHIASAQNGMPISRRAVPSSATESARYSGTCTMRRSANTPIHSTVTIV